MGLNSCNFHSTVNFHRFCRALSASARMFCIMSSRICLSESGILHNSASLSFSSGFSAVRLSTSSHIHSACARVVGIKLLTRALNSSMFILSGSFSCFSSNPFHHLMRKMFSLITFTVYRRYLDIKTNKGVLLFPSKIVTVYCQ
jgi:hypothetical protein